MHDLFTKKNNLPGLMSSEMYLHCEFVNQINGVCWFDRFGLNLFIHSMKLIWLISPFVDVVLISFDLYIESADCFSLQIRLI